MTSDFDVCIVGAGASGCMAAYELARAGLRVVVLEEGDRLPVDAALTTVERGWSKGIARTPEGRMRSVGRPWTACALGGGMTLFAGIMFRMREVDFDVRRHTSPDALDPRWPFDYGTLRPYYDEVEQLLGIARADRSDPFEPPGAPAVMPPHPYSPAGIRIAHGGEKLGWRPFPTPVCINSVPYRGRPACGRDRACNEHVCPTGARADALSILLDPLIRAGIVTVVPRARVVRIRLGTPSRARAVEWVDLTARAWRVTRADHVVLAANAIQSSAVMLRSTAPGAPAGLGNDHGLVGRGLSYKVSCYVHGDVAATGHDQRGPLSTVAFSDHYLDPDCPSGLGGLIYEANDHRHTDSTHLRLRLNVIAADQPMARNRVLLANTTDRFGLARLIMRYTTHPWDTQRLRHLTGIAERILRAAGAVHLRYEDSRYWSGSRHLHGGCRAGTDPGTSVVDEWGRVHGMDNLSVVDGGFFPYASGVNPTFTIQANALRVARRIAGTLRGTVRWAST